MASAFLPAVQPTVPTIAKLLRALTVLQRTPRSSTVCQFGPLSYLHDMPIDPAPFNDYITGKISLDDYNKKIYDIVGPWYNRNVTDDGRLGFYNLAKFCAFEILTHEPTREQIDRLREMKTKKVWNLGEEVTNMLEKWK